MNWTTLYQDFLNGKPDAVEAIFAVLGFILGAIGTLVVLSTFKKQRMINTQQFEINRLLMEENRRQVRPRFSLNFENHDDGKTSVYLLLKNAFARNVIFEHINYGTKGEVTGFYLWEMDAYKLELFQKQFAYADIEVTLIKIYYEDEDERKYSQNIFTKVQNIFISFPQLLKPTFLFPEINCPKDNSQI